MSTLHAHAPHSHELATRVAHRLHHGARTVRWAPAPAWQAGGRVRYLAYLGGSFAVWTLLGLGGSMLLGGATQVLASSLAG